MTKVRFTTALAMKALSQLDLDELAQNVDHIQFAIKQDQKTAKKGGEMAESLYSKYQDTAYQENIKKERNRVIKDVYEPMMEKAGIFATEAKVGGDDSESLLDPGERIYLFVSSSMPMLTLRNYAADIAHRAPEEVVMVMRGMVGGFALSGLRDTQKFVQKVIQIDPGCDFSKKECDSLDIGIMIDPELFSRYDIDRVPTTVFATGVKVMKGNEGRSEGDVTGTTVGNYYKVSGDYSLAANLEIIQQEAKSEGLGRVISALR